MTQAFTSGMEFCHGALGDGIGHDGREALVHVGEQWFVLQNIEHLFRVIFPISRAMNITARLDSLNQIVNEGLGNQTAFVVSRLSPGVGKIDVHSV